MPSERPPRPGEPEAVRTTIVGGRPPGSGKPMGPIPRGIEVLIKKAAVDTEFKRLLLARRDEAAREIGLPLDPAEALMLRAASAAQLEAIIDRTTVAPSILPAFLGRAAAVMLAALGATTVLPAAQDQPVSKGVQADVAGLRAQPTAPLAAPDADQPKPDYPAQVMRGIQAIRPASVPPGVVPSLPASAAAAFDGYILKGPPESQTVPPQAQEMAGARADRPAVTPGTEPLQPGVAGIMPDRPPESQPAPVPPPQRVAGARADRPEVAPDAATDDTERPAQPPITGKGGSRPDKPSMSLGGGGVRPEKPPIATDGGVRPDRPETEKSGD